MSMKRTVAAAVLAATMMAPVTASAAGKYGVVNIGAIVQQLPQMNAALEAIRAEFAPELEKVQAMEKDIAYNQDKLKREAMTMSEQEKADLQRKIVELGRQYQAMGQELDQKLRARQGEERNKLLALVKQSIDSIAAEQGYDMVFSSGAVVFVKDEATDISATVVEQLSKLN